MTRLQIHLATLRAQHAATDLAIAKAAGVHRATVHAARTGTKPVRQDSAALLLAVRPSDIVTLRRPAGATRLRLRALAAMGHSCPRIGTALGISADHVNMLQSGAAETVEPDVATAVAWLFEQWWDKRAPERDRYERLAAAASRARALRGDWCAAAGFDEDRLEEPGYSPACGYRPARGNGIAADVRWQVAS
jgi:hypothetical protein